MDVVVESEGFTQGVLEESQSMGEEMEDQESDSEEEEEEENMSEDEKPAPGSSETQVCLNNLLDFPCSQAPLLIEILLKLDNLPISIGFKCNRGNEN